VGEGAELYLAICGREEEARPFVREGGSGRKIKRDESGKERGCRGNMVCAAELQEEGSERAPGYEKRGLQGKSCK